MLFKYTGARSYGVQDTPSLISLCSIKLWQLKSATQRSLINILLPGTKRSITILDLQALSVYQK
jgi:hypothetical protein